MAKGRKSDFTIENLIRHWNKIVDIESSAKREKKHLEDLTDKKLNLIWARLIDKLDNNIILLLT
jgi:hypothetical protein